MLNFGGVAHKRTERATTGTQAETDRALRFLTESQSRE